MYYRKNTLIIIAVFIVTIAHAAAAPQNLKLDPAHTHIIFEVNHQDFAMTIGEFDTFEGGIQLDTDNPSESSVEVTISADSIDTNWPTRDNHLRSKDFFDVDQFPSISFKSRNVEIIGENRARVIGDLTMKGQTHEIELSVVMNKFEKGLLTSHAGFSAATDIMRSDWGMTSFLPDIGDNIKIRIEVEAK